MSSEARLYTFSEETKSKLNKFRTASSRKPGPQAVMYMIDKKTLEIKQDGDGVLNSLDEIAEELPDNMPRFVLLSHPLTLPDGRKPVPYVMLYYLPQTCNRESLMVYAGAKELMRTTSAAGKVIDIESTDDLEGIQDKLLK